MRVIKIDPHKRAITEIDLPEKGNLEAYQNMVGGNIEAAYIEPEGIVYVHDEGLYVQNQRYFLLKTMPQPLAGVGVVVGTDGEGNDAASPLTVEQIESMVIWGDPMYLMQLAEHSLGEDHVDANSLGEDHVDAN